MTCSSPRPWGAISSDAWPITDSWLDDNDDDDDNDGDAAAAAAAAVVQAWDLQA
jgi:hypothetical protein